MTECGWQVLHIAVLHQGAEKLGVLLDPAADIATVTPQGQQVLHVALHPEVPDDGVLEGADPFDGQGGPPVALLGLLVDRGANIIAADVQGTGQSIWQLPVAMTPSPASSFNRAPTSVLQMTRVAVPFMSLRPYAI